jgi:Copper type II ascorbate-dependent monooxygenase, C-terminal domain
MTRALRLLAVLTCLFGVALAATPWLPFLRGETRPANVQARNLGVFQARASGWIAGSKIPPLLSYIPTYQRDVKPILERHCSSCHTDGGIGPFRLDDPKAVLEHADVVRHSVIDKRMPPWLAGGESPKFVGERSLSDDEIAIIANWSWAGAPAGTAQASSPVQVQPSSFKPDVTLETGFDFVPDAKLSDEYRCFMLDPKLTGDLFLSGYDILPGDRRLVHHVLMYELTPAAIAEALALEKQSLEAQSDKRGGYTCFGGPRLSSQLELVGAWAPGSSATVFPTGTGARLRAGSRILMQVHYNLSAGAKTDRTRIALAFAPQGSSLQALRNFAPSAPVELACKGPYTPDRSSGCHRESAYARVLALNNSASNRRRQSGAMLTQCKRNLEEFTAGNLTGRSKTSCEYSVPADLEVRGVAGHMHYLGTSIKLEFNSQDPKRHQVLLEIPRWDFHWQGFYWLEQPMQLRMGDTFKISCEFDNSPENQPWLDGKQRAPRYTVWGEGTEEEMCLAYVQTTLR